MIPNEYLIYDKRSIKDFKNITFSNFKINEVLSIFEKKLKECKLEESIHWAIELLISGYISKFWDKIFNVFLKYININNPNSPILIYNYYCKYITLLKNNDFLSLRNNQECRNLVAGVTFVIATSLKTKAIGFVKIKNDDLNLNILQTKFISNDSNLINNKIKYGDPEETKIILNEFNFCLINKKYEMCVYWLSWILNWEKINTKKNKNYICGYREISNVDSKYYTDLVWLIWEIIIKETSKLNNEDFNINILSLFKLYKYDFKPSKKQKNSYYILFAIRYFTENYTFSKKINNYNFLVQVCSNINFIFFDKTKYSVNDTKKNEKIMYLGKKKELLEKQQQQEKKHNIKKLKDIAEEKMRIKINTVEQIDKLMMKNL